MAGERAPACSTRARRRLAHGRATAPEHQDAERADQRPREHWVLAARAGGRTAERAPGRKRGPIETFVPRLREWGLLDDTSLAALEAAVAAEVADAVAFAEAGTSYLLGGYLDDDDGHIMCREAAFDPAGSPCQAQHVYYDPENADDYSWGYATYRLMDGIGIGAVMEIGGNFIERLRHHGLSSELDFLYVVHGTTGGAGAPFEIDGMSCPACEVHGDGVLFDVSVAARDQLTQGWPDADKAARSRQEGVPFGHLEVGVTPEVLNKIISQLDAVQ